MILRTTSYSFHCTTAGDSTRPAVLFLHGFLGSGEDWRPIMAALADEYYCIAPDLPGHGTTAVHGADTLYGMEQTAVGLADALHTLGVAQCAVVGYSMGGRLALYMTARGSVPVRATVLESSSPGLRTAGERAARRRHDEALARELDTLPFDDILERWYAQPLFAPLKEHPAFPAVLARRRRNTPAALALSLRFMGTGVQPSLWDDLPGLSIPLLLLTGERDAKFVGIGQEMQTLVPAAVQHVVEGAGHTINVEQTAVYIELVRGFLREHNS